MEQGIYGFPPGKNITVDYQEFETTGIWQKPANAKLCFIRASGGGQGASGSAGSNTGGGSAGCGMDIWLYASKLKPQELVTIGAGGAGGAAGGGAGSAGSPTIFSNHTWPGGAGTTTARNIITGSAASTGWGSGASAGNNNAGRHGGFGAGGGGGGGTTGNGGVGGKPRSVGYVANSTSVATGGSTSFNAIAADDVDGFGCGGQGGGSVTASGGNGRRGGGGGGATNNAAASGGNGGDGFLAITTYCWE